MLKRTALIAGSLAGLLLAGCGSSSSSSSSSGGSSSAGAAGSVSAGAGAGGDYCTIAKSLATASNGFSSLSPSSDVSQVKSLIATFAAEIDAAAAQAPSSVAADWNTLKTAYDSANQAVQSAKTTTDAFSVLTTKFDSPAISTAGKNIDAATKSACGFTIGSSSSSASEVAPTPGTTDTGSGSGSGSETATSSTSS
jgi:hypothetical protein